MFCGGEGGEQGKCGKYGVFDLEEHIYISPLMKLDNNLSLVMRTKNPKSLKTVIGRRVVLVGLGVGGGRVERKMWGLKERCWVCK